MIDNFDLTFEKDNSQILEIRFRVISTEGDASTIELEHTLKIPDLRREQDASMNRNYITQRNIVRITSCFPKTNLTIDHLKPFLQLVNFPVIK